MSLSPELVQNLVRAALAEDVGAGDITTESAVPADLQAEAVIIAKEPCVVAGLPVMEAVFAELDPALTVTRLAGDGELVATGRQVCRLKGRARAILTGERTALNF